MYSELEQPSGLKSVALYVRLLAAVGKPAAVAIVPCSCRAAAGHSTPQRLQLAGQRNTAAPRCCAPWHYDVIDAEAMALRTEPHHHRRAVALLAQLAPGRSAAPLPGQPLLCGQACPPCTAELRLRDCSSSAASPPPGCSTVVCACGTVELKFHVSQPRNRIPCCCWDCRQKCLWAASVGGPPLPDAVVSFVRTQGIPTHRSLISGASLRDFLWLQDEPLDLIYFPNAFESCREGLWMMLNFTHCAATTAPRQVSTIVQATGKTGLPGIRLID